MIDAPIIVISPGLSRGYRVFGMTDSVVNNETRAATRQESKHGDQNRPDGRQVLNRERTRTTHREP